MVSRVPGVIMVLMRLIVVLFIFVVQVLSESVTADTTSGRLLGAQADGGMSSLLLLSFF
jgi:hypothetical protein